ncbi:hypothetical protein IWQ60_012225 [Tieghemiomyces parasiticus]|uniref:Uncharacterized protein n=1 Tax=Tieghemiomyces parasiticus TaxID=78921 RepID=A0A9W7ZFP6_9FUNG|nr:hypothetical protein IWQ60_012225 [Tieghemiomyces parasiticus]
MLRRELTQSQREVESRITSWRAVIRSSLRHFIVNFALLALVFLFPYWRRAPGVNRAAEALKRFIVFVLTFLPQRWQLTRFIEQRFRRTIYRIPSH